MAETHESLLTIVNASGFPLQLRLEHEIASRTGIDHKWQVLVREHRWIDPLSGTENFIDLILETKHRSIEYRMVIECKKVSGGTWVFLTPKEAPYPRRANLHWTNRQREQEDTSGWGEFYMTQLDSPEAMFCVVKGHSDKDRPMLERVAGNLLRSVECLAKEEASLRPPDRESEVLYFPVIVTTAEIQTCAFDIDDIDLKSGLLSDGQFDTVSCIRFRKSLSTTTPPEAKSLEKANEENQRTVFVMKSDYIVPALSKWLVDIG